MANGDMTAVLSVSGTDDGGDAYQISNTETTSSCVRVAKWRTPVPTGSDTVILTFNATVTGNAFTAVSRAFFINQDGTNFATIGYRDDSAQSSYFKIPAGSFHVLNSRDIEANINGAAFTGTFSTIDTVICRADTAAVDLDTIIYHT